MSKLVYISAASAEMDRVQGLMGQIAVAPNLTNAHDWTKSFSDPRTVVDGRRLGEAELPPRLRREFANEDVHGVLNADYFWLLAPGRQPSALQEMMARTLDGLTDKERAVLDHRFASDIPKPGLPDGPLHQTKGAWFELGVAHTAKMLRGAYPTPIILVSGAERLQSIFTEVADYFFETDQEALDWLRKQ